MKNELRERPRLIVKKVSRIKNLERKCSDQTQLKADGGKESSESQKSKQHKKVLEKGKPDDVMPGIRGRQDPLPSTPISGRQV